MRHWLVLLLGAWLAGCAQVATNPPATPAKSTAPLLDTDWKLTQLGERLIEPRQGGRELHFVMRSKDQRVTGFSGCNQMMGRYVLEGSELKFAQMGGTLMACTGDASLEREFLAMFGAVARWEISGQTLHLQDADGGTLATFVQHPAG
ncbi:MAG TPA: META domain-containing protein [Steroidobacteraceae bacterium]|nr:META domain-containing protein [Steroidobacteraceae bacterium]